MKQFTSVLPFGNREGADGKVRMDVNEWVLWGKKLLLGKVFTISLRLGNQLHKKAGKCEPSKLVSPFCAE